MTHSTMSKHNSTMEIDLAPCYRAIAHKHISYANIAVNKNVLTLYSKLAQFLYTPELRWKNTKQVRLLTF